jgi:hypothetical protein
MGWHFHLRLWVFVHSGQCTVHICSPVLNYIVGVSLEAGSVYGLMVLVRDGGDILFAKLLSL